MKRLLFISHCVPYPPDKGERIRAFHELRALSRRFEVTLACLARGGQAAAAGGLQEWCKRVVIAPVGRARGLLRGAMWMLRGRPITAGFFYTPRMRRRLGKLLRDRRFDLVMGYSSAALGYVLGAAAEARVMDLVDMDSVKWRSYAEHAGSLSGWLYRREARGVAELERQAIRACDAVICVSRAEAQAAPLKAGNLRVIPNGVDTQYFDPPSSAANAPARLVFVGTMNYRPNVDAVCWFVKHVWPGLKRRFPELELEIVGRCPTRAVRRLSSLGGVAVAGEVPDVRPHLSRARVAVASLRIARGVQNKVLEAMAMARPVVASPAALEGLDLPPCPGLLRAEAPWQWRKVLTGLLADPRRCGELGQAARELVRRRRSWASCMDALLSLCWQLT